MGDWEGRGFEKALDGAGRSSSSCCAMAEAAFLFFFLSPSLAFPCCAGFGGKGEEDL